MPLKAFINCTDLPIGQCPPLREEIQFLNIQYQENPIQTSVHQYESLSLAVVCSTSAVDHEQQHPGNVCVILHGSALLSRRALLDINWVPPLRYSQVPPSSAPHSWLGPAGQNHDLPGLLERAGMMKL